MSTILRREFLERTIRGVPVSHKHGVRLAQEVVRLSAIIDEVHSWVVCYAITTPEDMAQSFEHVAQITAPPQPTL